MATVIEDNAGLNLEFTALELDLMREIAFNTGTTVGQVAADRLSSGITCEHPGEDADYELRYEPVDMQDGPPKINLRELEIDGPSLQLRSRLREILWELYNIAWSRGSNAPPGTGPVEEDRKLHIAIRIDMIMNALRGYCDEDTSD